MKVQGKFKMEAHPTSDVVMDIAAFKVSHCVGVDIDATALRAARGEVKLRRGDGCTFREKVQNSSRHH